MQVAEQFLSFDSALWRVTQSAKKLEIKNLARKSKQFPFEKNSGRKS